MGKRLNKVNNNWVKCCLAKCANLKFSSAVKLLLKLYAFKYYWKFYADKRWQTGKKNQIAPLISETL